MNPKSMNSRMRKTVEYHAFLKKPFIIMMVIYMAGILAIVRADWYYIDDVDRATTGMNDFDYFSRYIAYFLAQFVHADCYLTDISPLPQILAVFLLALSAVSLLYVVTGKSSYNIWNYIALIPLGLSPYFLECLSFKYDAPYMALSIMGPVMALLWREKKSTSYLIACIIGSLTFCMTYQPAAGILPMLVVFLCVKDWNEGRDIKEITKFLLTSVIGYGAGMIIFKLFILSELDTYVSTSIFPLRMLIPSTLSNLKHYYSLVISDLKKEWLILIGIIFVCYIWVTVRESKRNKFVALLMTISALGIELLLVFGVYPFLERPSFSARAMYGLGVLISMLAVRVTMSSKDYLAKVCVFLLSWAFFVFSFTYGNALSAQKTYTDFHVSMIVEELNKLDVFQSDETTKVIEIDGTIGQSPILRNMPQDYQILNRLVPTSGLSDVEWWGTYDIVNLYGLKNVTTDSSIDLTMYDLPVLSNTMYFTIKGNENNILIELK